MRIERFEQIEGWQEARALALELYQISGRESFSRDLALRDQIRKAGVSTMANISEGFGRDSPREFVRFLRIARSSGYEVQSHLYVARDLGYISAEEFDRIYRHARCVCRLIGGFIRYLENCLGPRRGLAGAARPPTGQPDNRPTGQPNNRITEQPDNRITDLLGPFIP
jgi:four helix bundle protein